MSSELPWSRDPNIVGDLLGVLTGVIMLAGVGYLYLEGGPQELMLPLGGFGFLLVVAMSHSAVKTLRELGEAGITDPVVILKKDMRPVDEIVGRLLRLALLWVGLLAFYAVVLAPTPSEAPSELLALGRTNPLLAAGVVVVNLLLVVATVFVRPGSSRSGGSV